MILLEFNLLIGDTLNYFACIFASLGKLLLQELRYPQDAPKLPWKFFWTTFGHGKNGKIHPSIPVLLLVDYLRYD